MSNSLVSLAALKAQLNMSSTDTSNDTELQLYADAAASVVEDHTGLVFDSRSFTEVFDAGTSSVQYVPSHKPVTDVTRVTSMQTGDTWDVTGVQIDGDLWFFNAPLTGVVEIVYTAGTSQPAAKHQLAGLIIAQHLWETQRGDMPLVAPELQDSMGVLGQGYAIPNRALELLGASMPGIA